MAAAATVLLMTAAATTMAAVASRAAAEAPATAVVCVAQILVNDGELDGNLHRIDRAAGRCKALGADMAVFPETSLLGWDNPLAFNASWGRPVPGAHTQSLSVLARAHNMTMVVGLAERVNATVVHDSAVLLGADGTLLGTHRKINILKELMDPPYTPGTVDTANVWAVDTPCCGRVGVLICADTFLANVVQFMAGQKPDIVAVPYGWSGCDKAGNPGQGGCAPSGVWPAHGHDLVNLVQGVANMTGAAVAGADSVGQQSVGPWSQQTYGGWSPIAVPVAPDGSGGILVVAADRDVDVQVATVPLRSRL